MYNPNGYDAFPSLEMMDGLIDIYMPDLKYAADALGQKYSDVPDYYTVAQAVLLEMYRQVGDPVIENGIMRKGVLIRHLMMPGLTEDSMRVLDWIKANLPAAVVNLMEQYRPTYRAKEYEEINRRPTSKEFMAVKAHFNNLDLHMC